GRSRASPLAARRRGHDRGRRRHLAAPRRRHAALRAERAEPLHLLEPQGGALRDRAGAPIGEPTVHIDERPPDAGAPERRDADLDALAGLLHAAVHGGAGVSFVVPFSLDDARRFWSDRVVPAVRDGSKRVLVARIDDTIAGTVQLDFPWPPN